MKDAHCEHCGELFRQERPRNKFCSRKCMGLSQRAKSNCVVCGDVMDKNINLPVGWDSDCSADKLKSYGLDFSEDQKQWPYEKLLEYINTQFGIHDKGTAGRMKAIEVALEKMSSSTKSAITPVEENLLLEKIRSNFGKSMSLGSMRKQMHAYSAGPVEGKDHTEIAKAVIRDLEQETEFRFHQGRFWAWEGSHWTPFESQQIRLTIAQNYGNLDAARRASDHKGIMDIMTHVAKQGLTEIEIYGVNFANGVFTEDGKLIDHKHEYGFTYTLPYRYLPDIGHKATLFDKFLEGCWGKDEDYLDKRDALQEAICATMYGWAPRYQRVFCLFGVARSGKSQLLEIVEGLVPSNSVSSVSFDRWNDQPSLVALDGKLVNIVGEMSTSKNIAADIFNKVVVGEAISMRQLYQTTYLTRLKCAHWVGSNHPPKSDDHSSGFNRRWLYLTFDHQVQTKDIIPNLGRRIITSERESIMSWAMEARERLVKKHEYTLPASHIEWSETVSGVNDNVKSFVLKSGRVRTVPKDDAGNWTTNPVSDLQLFGAYTNFCIMQGVRRPVEYRMFQLRMREIGQIQRWDRKQGTSDVTGEKVALYYGPELVSETSL